MATKKTHIKNYNNEDYPNMGKEWTLEEMDLVMNSNLKDDEIAEILGRTVPSIWQARFKSRKRNVSE